MISLREVTPDNHLDVRALSVHPDQQKFVASIDKSLADAFVWEGSLVRAGYKNDTAIGFTLIYPFETEGLMVVNIVRFLIDAQYQGQGLGRLLLQLVLDWIDSLSPDVIRISTVPDNDIALSLYRSVGFVETGVEYGEIVLEMKASRRT